MAISAIPPLRVHIAATPGALGQQRLAQHVAAPTRRHSTRLKRVARCNLTALLQLAVATNGKEAASSARHGVVHACASAAAPDTIAAQEAPDAPLLGTGTAATLRGTLGPSTGSIDARAPDAWTLCENVGADKQGGEGVPASGALHRPHSPWLRVLRLKDCHVRCVNDHPAAGGQEPLPQALHGASVLAQGHHGNSAAAAAAAEQHGQEDEQPAPLQPPGRRCAGQEWHAVLVDADVVAVALAAVQPDVPCVAATRAARKRATPAPATRPVGLPDPPGDLCNQLSLSVGLACAAAHDVNLLQ